MKKLILAATIASLSTGVNASIETLDWHEFASPEARNSHETIVLDFYASPSAVGFTEDSDVARYITSLAHERGITGASVTIAAPHTQTCWRLSLNMRSGQKHQRLPRHQFVML
ncbi:hypothetical protein O9992_17360 [Vibrio lentus]|nr:hypothetical protein [Vibrio lentus]